MEIVFLGTAAATGYPLPFCKCKNCSDARKFKGKSIRKRSSVLIDDTILIDLCPDFLSAMNMYEKDSSNIKILLQTHPHSDHFDAGHFVTRMKEYATESITELQIVASENCFLQMSEMIKENENVDIFSEDYQYNMNIKLTTVEHGKSITIDKYKITALESLHDIKQGSIIFLIESQNKTILYATDTVQLTDRTLQFLKDKHLSCLILDHTYGNIKNSDGHLNEKLFINEIDRLKNINTINNKSLIYATHISHEGCPYHEKMESLAKDKYKVAYDGLKIII